MATKQRRYITEDIAADMTAAAVRRAQDRNSKEESDCINALIYAGFGALPTSVLRRDWRDHPAVVEDINLFAERTILAAREKKLRDFGWWRR